MNLALSNQRKKYPLYEWAALAFSSAMIGLGLVSNIIYLDWLFDTLFWLAGVWLVYWERKERKMPDFSSQAFSKSTKIRLLVCLYLVVDSILLMLVALPNAGIMLFIYLVLSGLYGAALLLRLREQAIFISRFGWRQLFQPPALSTTISLLLPLVCLYEPMVDVYQADPMWTGPMVFYLPGTVHMYAGGTIDLGSTVTVRGYQVVLGHLALLLLAGLAVLHVVTTEGLVASARSLLLRRVALVLVVLWWGLVAKGYNSLEHLANLLFIGGCGWLLVRLFRL